MADFIIWAIGLGLTAGALGMGFLVGGMVERRHLRSLVQREEATANIVCTTLRRIPSNWSVRRAAMVNGQAVIGSDHFKTFAAKIYNLFGGEVRSLETLLDRARREATLRMIDEAVAMGANAVWNIRYETSSIGFSAGKQGAPMAEVIAYGTALCVEGRK